MESLTVINFTHGTINIARYLSDNHNNNNINWTISPISDHLNHIPGDPHHGGIQNGEVVIGAKHSTSLDEMEITGSSSVFDQMSQQERSCHVYDFLMEAMLMGVLCLLGFGGNTLSMICLSKDRSKTATPFLLISLEAADTCFLLTVLVLRVLTSLHLYTGPGQRPIDAIIPYLSKYVFPLALIAMTATIYLTILVTVNRYISVCKPYQALDLCSVKQARRHVVVTVVLCVLYNLPRFFEKNLTFDVHPDTNTTYVREVISPMARSPIYQILYANVLYCLVMFLIPLIALIILNLKLIKALSENKRKRALMQSSDHGSSRSEEDITLTLIIVVLVFLFTQTPALVTQLLQTFLPARCKECPSAFFYYERVSDLLVVFNSSINFLIYCFCSRRFRQILVVLLCKNSRIAREVSFMNRSSYKTAINGGSSRKHSKSSVKSIVSSARSHSLNNGRGEGSVLGTAL